MNRCDRTTLCVLSFITACMASPTWQQNQNWQGNSWTYNQVRPWAWNQPAEAETTTTTPEPSMVEISTGAEYNTSAVDRILHILGFRRNVCPFGAIPLVRNPAGQQFEDKYQMCDPRSVAACPAGYVCDRSRYRQYHICCASYDPVSSTSTKREQTTSWVPWSTPSTVSSSTASTTMSSTTTTSMTTPGTTASSTTTTTMSTAAPTTTTTVTTSTPEPLTRTLGPVAPHAAIPELIPLTSGSMVKLAKNEYQWATSITLVKDEGKYYMVDAGVPADTNAVVRELSRNGLTPDDVSTLILTHGHPDHLGNLNVFSTKHQIFYDFEYIGNRFKQTELLNSPSKQISPNIELWKTPGHTQQDLTVVVRNVPSFGVVAITGDLVLNEDFIRKPDDFLDVAVWNSRVQWENVKTVLCAADFIVPGHGSMFRVTDEYKLKAECKEPAYVYSPFRRFGG